MAGSNFFQQLWLLTIKNYQVQIRSISTSIWRILLPLLWMGLYFFLSSNFTSIFIDGKDNPPPAWTATTTSLPECKPGLSLDCHALLYTHSDSPFVQSIMSYISSASGLVLGEQIAPFPSDVSPGQKWGENWQSAIYNWLENNKNTTAAVLHFDINQMSTSPDIIPYTLFMNHSRYFDEFQPLQWSISSGIAATNELPLMIDAAILSYYSAAPTESPVDLSVTRTLFKRPAFEDISYVLSQVDAVASPIAILLSMVFLFHVPMMSIVRERMSKVAQGLTVMGLSQGAYLMSWFLFYLGWAVYSILIITWLGHRANIRFFTATEPSVYLLILAVAHVLIISFGIAASSVFHQTKTAMAGASAFYITALILSVRAGNGLEDMIPGLTTSLTGRVLNSMPFFNFYTTLDNMRCVLHGEHYCWRWNRDDFPEYPSPYKWSDLSTPVLVRQCNYWGDKCWSVEIPSAMDRIQEGIALALFYLVGAWFLSLVFPGEYGVVRNPLSPSYWGLTWISSSSSSTPLPPPPHSTLLNGLPEYVDPAIEQEKTLAQDPTASSTYGLHLLYLFKSYRKSLLDSNPKVAVNNLSLVAEKSSCLALLGHNGAGKTTTINVLTGVTSASSGVASIYGISAIDTIDAVRQQIGVCPQHDILWEDLTAKEHCLMFARLKGVSSPSQEADRVLATVHLTSVADHYVKTFSGGMKRRLSVAISTVGDPSAIFLDEPTSGLDPVNKRHIWDLVRDMKQSKLILLTTHAMAEADALADKIAILAAGRLKAVGNSLELKEKYGAGYHVNVLTKPGREGEVEAMIKDTLGPDVVLDASNAGNMDFSVRRDKTEIMPRLIQLLTDAKNNERDSGLIIDYGLSHTTLDEVFLKITTGSKAEIHDQQANVTPTNAPKAWWQTLFS